METLLQKLYVRYGDAAAIAAIDLQFARGEQAAIIGPSGAGKTTLLHTIACAMKPTEGALTVLGVRPWELTTRQLHRLRRRLFLAPQAPPLPPRQRVIHAVLAGRLAQWSMWQALRSLVYPLEINTAQQALERFRLADKLFLRCDRLSGGERQRVGLARVLTSSAELFLLDEPVSSLDPALANEALQTLQEEARHRQATMVVSLHAVDLARARFPRLIGIKQGYIAFDLPREKVSDALLADLYGAELTTSFQSVEEAVSTQMKLQRCL